MKKITIAICTYNRCDLLLHCLESLTKQTIPSSEFEVLVVNNNSKDETNACALKFEDKFEHFKLIVETNQGLSFARNRAYKEASSEWVLYLDDDAKARFDFVERGIWMIENHNYLCFGGMYLPWYHYGEPYWYKENYGSNRMKYKDVVTLKSGEYASGGVFAVKKSQLEKYNGFLTSLGMNGGKRAFGEETELQIRMRKDNMKIGYDPFLIIEHIVAEHKLSLDSFFQEAFALGRDQIVMGIAKTSSFNLIITGLILVGMIILHLFWYTPRLLLKDYYIQNWMIDVFKKPAKRIGILYTALVDKSKNKRKG